MGRWSRRRWRKGTECVGGWIQIRMKCPKQRGHVRRNNDEIELRKWQSKINNKRISMIFVYKPKYICLFTFEFRNTS